MGRKVRRVPLDFDAPLNKVWPGFLMPDALHSVPCPSCEGSGWSAAAKHLQALWYGNAPFTPADNGSTPLTPETPAVRAFADRNVSRNTDFYGHGDYAIHREALRLANLWNGQWSHHLNEADVAALLEAGRLYDLTHTWTSGSGWQPIDPPVVPTPEQVNEWSILTFGHDSINSSVAVRARCARDGVNPLCEVCGGEGSRWRDDQHKADHEAWQPTDPPVGDGWQLWETVSEGSPISPVFPSADELASWMSDPQRGEAWVPAAVAAQFIAEGWAPSLVGSGDDLMSGVEFVGTR